MALLLAMSRHTGIRLAEVAFLLLLIDGLWLAAAQLSSSGFARTRSAIAGAGLAVAAVLLIVATHWGHFG